MAQEGYELNTSHALCDGLVLTEYWRLRMLELGFGAFEGFRVGRCALHLQALHIHHPVRLR